MGNCFSDTAPNKKSNQKVKSNKKTKNKSNKIQVKLLLLGAGDSGKSTLLKQAKIIHKDGFSDKEKSHYRKVIYSNLIESLKNIFKTLKTLENVNPTVEFQSYFELVDTLDPTSKPESITKAIRALSLDDKFQNLIKKQNEYQCMDSLDYLDQIERITDLNYIPDEQDILRCREKTTEIHKLRFEVNSIQYCIIDVGGQRSERRKWMDCFKDVTAVLFMVAISEYDQVLVEDESMNRMSESLMLFQSICDMDIFKHTSIILFMNKIDIFKKKLKSSPLHYYFPDYKGGDDCDKATAFIMDQFQSLSLKNHSQEVYTHLSCATDTDQIKFFMSAVNDIILKTNLTHIGLV